MFLSKILTLSAVSLAVVTVAFPFNLGNRESCEDVCGSNCYDSDDINAALNQGYTAYEDGTTYGSDDYPHQYHDYEGFDFPVDGPWYEFPILADHSVYDGGSPGPDRVVFNGDGELAGLITHTGASGDDFLECSSG